MMKTPNHIIAALLWIVGLTMLGAKSCPIWGMLFFVPFALGPHLLTHVGVFLAKSARSQVVLLVALLAYFAWFSYVYVDAFYRHLDAQSAIALVFVGIYASPVMALLWFVAYRFEKKARGQQSAGGNAAPPRASA